MEYTFNKPSNKFEFVTKHTNISRVYKGYHKTENCEILNVDKNHTIILTTLDYPKNVAMRYNNTLKSRHIAKSYYHVENLCQYINNTYNIEWTPEYHHLFGKYANKLVETVLICHKYSKYLKFMPKGVLYIVIQFIL